MPPVVGSVNVHEPAAAAGCITTVPDVLPASDSVPLTDPATPSVGVAVAVIALAVAEASNVPAAVVAG